MAYRGVRACVCLQKEQSRLEVKTGRERKLRDGQYLKADGIYSWLSHSMAALTSRSTEYSGTFYTLLIFRSLYMVERFFGFY